MLSLHPLRGSPEGCEERTELKENHSASWNGVEAKLELGREGNRIG